MVGKVVEFSGFSKPEMKFALPGLLSIYLILLVGQSLQKCKDLLLQDGISFVKQLISIFIHTAMGRLN